MSAVLDELAPVDLAPSTLADLSLAGHYHRRVSQISDLCRIEGPIAMFRWIMLAVTHAGMLGLGFAIGVYTLPLLTAPKGPEGTVLQATAVTALYKGRFDRNLKGSDFLHWGEGEVRIMRDRIALEGRLAPGPDYKLYVASSFVDTKEGFLKIKEQSRRVGDVKTFDGFIVDVPPGIDVSTYTTVVVWCEAFSQFISAAKYR